MSDLSLEPSVSKAARARRIRALDAMLLTLLLVMNAVAIVLRDRFQKRAL